jgi:hypothetical protein
MSASWQSRRGYLILNAPMILPTMILPEKILPEKILQNHDWQNYGEIVHLVSLVENRTSNHREV